MGDNHTAAAFDCFAADPDEPMFPLLASDPLAPWMTPIWSAVRRGDLMAAQAHFGRMIAQVGVDCIQAPDFNKALEALACARAMQAWREGNKPSR
jgi:hypothetical protein